MLESRKREIRIRAEDFRSNCKVGRYGIIDLFEECNRRNYKLFRYPLGEKADMGFSLKRDDDIIIFTNSSVRLSREIFTLAHEIGHINLHFSKGNSFVDNHNSVFGKSDVVTEQEANYFAACLLMPKVEVEKFFDLELAGIEFDRLSAFDITRIMSEFKVSFEMVLNRLRELEMITDDKKNCLDTEKTTNRVGNMLMATGGERRLNEASLEVALPFEYLHYAIYNYNHGTIPKETLEKTLDCYGFTLEDVKDKVVEPLEEELDIDELLGGL